ncbi:DUF87 domain-containing protein [Thermopolyspora sp. NPDC052614]|uniref:helicase HerA domain-containing protein n=1 Tax=Thermopolyspora sp. NPDC052614 TaxID=3155682 RepID=UPI00342D03A5
MADERSVLAGLRLDYTQAPDHVWRRSPYHVDTLHRDTAMLLLAGIEEARDSRDASPIGLVVKGSRGTGKTHLLGWVREQVQRHEGYFFLVGLLDARSFWDSVVVAMLDGLCRTGEDGRTQLEIFLARLSSRIAPPPDIRAAMCGDAPLTREALDAFVQAAARIDNQVIRLGRDTLRALVLRASADFTAQDIGEAYLTCGSEETPGEWALWGIRHPAKSPQEIVQDISRLLALTGPTVIAVDQIDMLVAQSGIRSQHAEHDWRGALLLEHVAHGLLSLREYTRRTLTIVSCLPDTWELIVSHATNTVQDRFRTTFQLGVLPDAETARLLVEKRFTAQYDAIGFTPPYPTWPVKPTVFAEAANWTPRALLIKIDDHIRSCLLSGEIREMDTLTGHAPAPAPRPVVTPGRTERALLALDERFAALRAAADVTMATNAATEDETMPKLLAAGLEAWVAALGEPGTEFTQDPEPSANPALHARLRRNLDESTEDQMHWAFRAIAATNARAVITRLRKAAVEAGLTADVPKRRLFVLRNDPWPTGPKTHEAVTLFATAGGRVLGFTEDDLKILAALRDLIAENPPHLRSWLASRKPVEHVGFLRAALDSWTDPYSPPPTDQFPPSAPVRRHGGLGPAGYAALAVPGDVLSDPKPPASAAPQGFMGGPITTTASGLTTTDEWRPSGLANTPADAAPSPLRQPIPTAPSHADVPLPAASPRDDATSRPAPGAAQHFGQTDGPNPAPAPGTSSPPWAGPQATGESAPPPLHHQPAAVTAAPSQPSWFDARPRAADEAPSPYRSATAPTTTPGQPTGPDTSPHIAVGRMLPSGPPVTVPLEALRKHTVIFAGSGSGKTVLIRRLVEECALHGVSAIVLDPNNDLARLGDPWPTPPPQWGPGDAAKAHEYLTHTDVAIWTPGRSMGRPLSFQPLPDFASVADHPDEFGEAVDIAVASIAPRAKLAGNTVKAERGRAVLREAIIHYGRRGGGGLKGLIDLLTWLPEGVSALDGAEKIAADIAQTLTAASVNDPLFGGDGTPADPGILLTPPPGKRARVSVISFIGLQQDDQRQSFVNQLQMALFAWIKKHPATGPLGGLLIMDEAQTFAPAGATTPCTSSTLALATQARKYGLGLIFATQSPKALHNRIPGNAATQFYGLLNAPAQIQAAEEMARAKGGNVSDISRLTTGQFYTATEGHRPVKIQTPLCLTHHPASPLTTEEVITLAARP